jgi:hypothetical protein
MIRRSLSTSTANSTLGAHHGEKISVESFWGLDPNEHVVYPK